MSTQTKQIKYEYYGVYSLQYDRQNNAVREGQEYVNLDEFLEGLSNMSIVDRDYEHEGEKVRVQVVSKMGDYWILQLVRKREGYLPGKGTEAGDFNPLQLEDDEWIGEDVTILYDGIRNTMMVQKNKNSLSVMGIERMFNYFINDSEHILQLRPQYSPIGNLTNQPDYTKIVTTFDMNRLNDENIREYNWLYQAINGTRAMNASRITITITSGRKRGEEYKLNSNEIIRLPNLSGIEGLEKLDVYKKEEQDSQVEILDLIDNKLCDFDILEHSRINPITHERIKSSMICKYNNRINN